MTTEPVCIPGGRDVRGRLNTVTDATAIVVACPPNPNHGGHRGDPRLTAVADALVERDIDCLRFDYGEWDGGYGEREDGRNAIRWAADRYESVGLFGYSFGGSIAMLAATAVDQPVAAVSTLAPTGRLADERDVAATTGEIGAALQVLYGTRDETVDWKPVVDFARDAGATVEGLSADHFFVGRHDEIGRLVGDFLADARVE